jgi:mono/diheme cytochrome c family protein
MSMNKTATRKTKLRAAALMAGAVLATGFAQHAPTVLADDDRPVIKVPRAGGRELFQNCVLCHKYDGRGGPSEGGYGADLRKTSLTREQLIFIITYGRQPKGMPPFKDLLDTNKIETLADFILNDLRLPELKEAEKASQ